MFLSKYIVVLNLWSHPIKVVYISSRERAIFHMVKDGSFVTLPFATTTNASCLRMHSTLVTLPL